MEGVLLCTTLPPAISTTSPLVDVILYLNRLSRVTYWWKVVSRAQLKPCVMEKDKWDHLPPTDQRDRPKRQLLRMCQVFMPSSRDLSGLVSLSLYIKFYTCIYVYVYMCIPNNLNHNHNWIDCIIVFSGLDSIPTYRAEKDMVIAIDNPSFDFMWFYYLVIYPIK